MRELSMHKDVRKGCFFLNDCALPGRSLKKVIEDLHDENLISLGASKIVCYNG